MSTDSLVAKRERLQFWTSRATGLIKDLRLDVLDIAKTGVKIRMPFNPQFCVDAEETLMHGGVLTTLLDSAFGLANFAAIDGVASMGTLDLRVDYLRPTRAKMGVIVEAECIRHTRHIAFNSGRVFSDDDARVEIARGTASFALTVSGVPLFVSANKPE